MALTIKQLLNYSWMSQASYLDFTGLSSGASGDSLKSKLQGTVLNEGKIFAEEQINTFIGTFTPDPTDGFKFVSYTPNDLTGFSATVFKSNADNSYTIAVRGTEPSGLQIISDLIWADGGGVVLEGKAFDQLREAYRYYKQITTAAGAAVQYTTVELEMLGRVQAGALLGAGRGFLASFLPSEITTAIGQVTALVTGDVGLGVLIPANAVINFTGHSLGGHVAYLLAEMVARSRGESLVGDIATYNAPSQNALLYEIKNWLGADSANTNSLVGSKHVAVIGEAGAEVTAGLGQVIGARQFMFIEDTPEVAANHSIVKLSDSLAMYDLLQKLSPSESDAQTKLFLEQASNKGKESLEKTLDGLRHTILGGTLTPTLITGDSDAAARTDYYKNIKDLTDNATFQALIGQVTLVAAPTTTNQAHTDFGAFLSLYYLTPFALHSNNGGAYDVLRNISPTNQSLAFRWENDNSPNPISDQKNFTDSWFNDRIAMLNGILQPNINDTAYNLATGLNGIQYTDIKTGIVLGSTTTMNVVFGSTKNETIRGQEFNDRLYGGEGDDNLFGFGGNDYIEGGSGFDYLNGGAGNDFLSGGDGSDILDGGSGADVLAGGEGSNTYMVGDADSIHAGNINQLSIKQGSVIFNGVRLNGGTRQTVSSEYMDSRGITYSLSGGILTVHYEDQSITISGFNNSDLGIKLEDNSNSPTVGVQIQPLQIANALSYVPLVTSSTPYTWTPRDTPRDAHPVIQVTVNPDGSVSFSDPRVALPDSLVGGPGPVYIDSNGKQVRMVDGRPVPIDNPTSPADKNNNGIPDIHERIDPTQLRDPFNQANHTVSPLVLDLDGDGIETTLLANGTHFDHDGNQFSEQTAWVGKDDGLLVRDVNGNGTIDNGSELFGNNTMLANGNKATDGFAALADLDSNQDGIINQQDTQFNSLQIWQDNNQDGTTQAGELKSLNQAGIQSLNLSHIISTQLDGNGNAFKQQGNYTKLDGTSANMVDVWFTQDLSNTVTINMLNVPSNIAALPNIIGSGNVYNLQQAMVRDSTGTLQNLIVQYGNTTDLTARHNLLDAIIYQWVGVQNVAANSRGDNVDARQLMAVEAFLGEHYLQGSGTNADPGPVAAKFIQEAYVNLQGMVDNQLTSQVNLLRYKPLLDQISLVIDANGISLDFSQVNATFETNIGQNAANDEYWRVAA